MEIKNNFPNENGQIYPVRVRYFYGDKKLYSRTIDINWFGSYTFSAYAFALGANEKYDSQKEIRIELVDRGGNLIDSKSQYGPPRYKFDFNQQKADIQLDNINITKTKFGIFSFRDDYYSVYFTLKNTNASYAFRGRIDFGDLGEQKDKVLQNWRVHYDDLILEPSQSFEIERSGLTEEELKNIKTELQTCMFC